MAKEEKEQEVNNLRYEGKNQLYKLLYGLRYTGIPVFIHGDPGVGKTSIIKFLGENFQVPVVILSGPQKEPTDFMGVPYLRSIPVDPKDPKNTMTTQEVAVSLPPFARVLKDNPNGIAFFDEISAAQPAVQTCMLSLVQDCVCGDITIPETTFRIAAGNYSGMVGVKRISMALNNRFVHIWYRPSADFVGDGFVSGWTNYETPVINPPEVQEKKEMQYRVLMSKLFKEHPEMVVKMPQGYENENDAAFPSPRSWMNLVKILSVLDGNTEDFLEELIIGTVGLAAGRLFIAKYLGEVELFNIDMTSYVGKEDTFFIPHHDKHAEVYSIMHATMYYFQKDPKKYYPLWVRVMNVMHNKEEKYGKYAPYDSLFMAFLKPSLKILVNKLPRKLERIAKDIPDWLELAPNWGDTHR